MTICVSVKTHDGIVLGTDSMSTVVRSSQDVQQVIEKSYSNARKLAQIGGFPVGAFTYGLGNLGSRTVYSHILEYSRMNKNDSVRGIATGLANHISPIYENVTKALNEKPTLGLYVAGYSRGSATPEEWEVVLPESSVPHPTRAIDGFGANWRGVPIPFARLYNGFDPQLFQLLENEGVDRELLLKVAQSNPFAANVMIDLMPLQDAINFAVYILRTTIGFTSFESGSTLCGGQLQIAVISEEAQEARFQWVSKPEFRIPEDTNEWA